MKIFLLFIILASGLAGIPVWITSRRALRRYWKRDCTGALWKRRFPQATNTELRQFLALFADAFGFSARHPLCFSPDDRILEVYRALYPAKGWPDDMELERFAMQVEETYGADIIARWHEGITLGELFGWIQRRGNRSAR